MKRKEQRAMQNTEIDDILNMKTKFYLQDQDGKEFSHESVLGKNQFTIFWFDPKMKNYLSLLEFINRKKFLQAKVQAILIVEKEEHLANVNKIKK